MPASLPPSSNVSRFRLPAAFCMMFLPVGVEPVNTILLMSGCFAIAEPTPDSPVTMFSTPGGRIAFASSTKRSVAVGVTDAGLITTVLPARSAGITCQIAIISGQFHGVIEPTTPSGLRCTSMRASRLSWITSTGSASSAVAWVHAIAPPTSIPDPTPFSPPSGLPASFVTSSISSGMFASSAAPSACSRRWRSASGVRLHAGNAARAAATAWSTCAGVPDCTQAKAAPVAGLMTSKVVSACTARPLMIISKVCIVSPSDQCFRERAASDAATATGQKTRARGRISAVSY